MPQGYAVEVTRDDGSRFFAYAGEGRLPAIWGLSGRKYAVEFKRELLKNLPQCRVVRIEYEDPAPRVIEMEKK